MSQPLEYSLIRKGITGNKSWSAIIHKGITADKKRIAKIMASRGTSLSQIDIEAVLDLFYQTVIDELREGNVVSTPVFRAELSIKGTFKIANEKFNHQKHKAHVIIQTAKGLNKDVCFGLKFRRSRHGKTSFGITEFYALKTASEDLFYPGCPVQLKGRGLKIYRTPAECRMEILKDHIPVAEADIIRYSDKRVMAFLPYDLEPGIYYMRYVRCYNGKEDRSASIGFVVRPKAECF